METWEKGLQSCQDIYKKISRGNSKFVTSVYRKPKLNGVLPNFESFILDTLERGSIEI